MSQLDHKRIKCIQTLVWIVFVVVLGQTSIGEVVVDFKSTTTEKHLVSDVEFADLDADGSHELILIESGYAGSLDYAVSISQLTNESRKVLWRGQDLPTLRYKILVGNIDTDEKDEVIVFRDESWVIDLEDHSDTTRVIEYEQKKIRETLYTSISGHHGALIDINNDSRFEIVLIKGIGPPLNDDRHQPTGIRLYSFADDQFKLLSEFDLKHTIRCLSVGDVDADGEPEIVTQEISNDGTILHQISVYDVSIRGEITHQFSKNKVLTFSKFPSRVREMRVFRDSAFNTYIATYRGRNWLSRVDIDDGIQDIQEIGADFELRTEAIRHKLPFNGSSYALIDNRQPLLILYTEEELSEVVKRMDGR